ncbi:MAG: sugar phosphate nucleotidyltransferase [Candidatus Goldbacteria bacterium]|nr:sugar phosphate nucleotidyltransferase [Candidatus Goldiibacteriota bacterium]
MKGIILAGGLGTRLYPLTRITNKHLLPVYDKPMIFYPIEMLVKAGIKDIMIVTGGNNSGDFLRLLGNGKEFGLKHIHYSYQEGEGGIADALKLCEDFVGNDKMVVALGDNIIEKNIIQVVKDFKKQKRGARILLKEVANPSEYGVAEIVNGKIKKIVEKPKKPKSNYAVLGIYFYPSDVFSIIKKLKPSKRGELEITDVNNVYLKKGLLKYSFLDGWWHDCGESKDALLDANNFVRQYGANKV